MPRADKPPHTELDDDTRALAALAELQRARRESDYLAAARAERELERLGYVVRVVRPIQSFGVQAADAPARAKEAPMRGGPHRAPARPPEEGARGEWVDAGGDGEEDR